MEDLTKRIKIFDVPNVNEERKGKPFQCESKNHKKERTKEYQSQTTESLQQSIQLEVCDSAASAYRKDRHSTENKWEVNFWTIKNSGKKLNWKIWLSKCSIYLHIIGQEHFAHMSIWSEVEQELIG